MIVSELETGVSRDWLCKGHRTHSPVGINNLLVQLSETRTLHPFIHVKHLAPCLVWQSSDRITIEIFVQWVWKHNDRNASSQCSLFTLCHWDHARTCNETVLPGDWRQVVTVDVAFKLKHFSRLHNQRRRRRERKMSLMVEIQQSPYLNLCVFAYVCLSDNL